MRRVTITLILVVILLPGLGFASSYSTNSYYGMSFSYAFYSKEPTHLNGPQLLLNYHPQRFQWSSFNLYFDGGIAYFWRSNTDQNPNITLLTLAPVIRYNFNQLYTLLPYADLSIGLTYLNHTRIYDRKLGIHFAFQDRAGFGVWLGSKHQYSIGLHIVHYSNARLSTHNSGITIPFMLDVGYRFQ